jgi:putative chitinase
MIDKERFARAVNALASSKINCAEHMIAGFDLLPQHGIDTPLKAAHFLSQCAHESGGFRLTSENLHYSSADRLHKIWPKRFPNAAAAEPYVGNPEKLANLVYAHRLGNGEPESGDGYRYRGRGLIQITGKFNYEAVGHAIGRDLIAEPDLAMDPELALLIACGTWHHIGASALSEDDTVTAFTHKVNGGHHGLEERTKHFELASTELMG